MIISGVYSFLRFRIIADPCKQTCIHMKIYPGNFNSEGKRKTVRVSGHSSYRGRLNFKFVIIFSNC